MTWMRFDDQFPDHPKMRAAGALAMALQVAAICYCGRHLTDGAIPASALPTLLDLTKKARLKAIASLVQVGAWLKTSDGFQIHDYDQYQPSRAAVLRRREKDVTRQSRLRHGVTGNGVTADSARPVPVPVPEATTTSKNTTEEGAAAVTPAREAESLYAIYENEIGTITPMIASALDDWDRRVPDAKFLHYAFEEAAENGARSWRYVESVLKRLEAEKWPPLDSPPVTDDEHAMGDAMLERRQKAHETKAAE